MVSARTHDADLSQARDQIYGDSAPWDKDLRQELTLAQLFEGWDGKLIMVSGVILPTTLFFAFLLMCTNRLALVSFAHPLETLAEVALAINIPIAIYRSWRRFRKNLNAYSLPSGITLGAAVGAGLVVTTVCIGGAIVWSDRAISLSALFSWLAISYAFTTVAAVVLAEKVRRRLDFATSRIRAITYTSMGIVLALCISLAAEARPWLVRIAERMAISTSPLDQQEGLKQLRLLNPVREMLVECSNDQAAGLSGLFMPLSERSERDLFFALTGEPFSFRDVNNKDLSLVSDDSLARQVVGEQIPGLTLLRSSLTGSIHPKTLSSTINWTFVFKNDSDNEQQARAEISVPQGAVVTKLTQWCDGLPQEAQIVDHAITFGHYQCQRKYYGGIGTVAYDLGRGRLLISCSHIHEHEELKLGITMVAPLKPDGKTSAALAMPIFIATNFDLAGDHQLRLRSPLNLTSSLTNLKTGSTISGDKTLFGTLTGEDVTRSRLALVATRPDGLDPVAVLDTKRTDPTSGQYIEQSIRKTAAEIPQHLVVVIDGSEKVGRHLADLLAGLKKIPSNIKTSLIVSSGLSGSSEEPLSLQQGLTALEKSRFTGGHDNLRAMIKAAEIAGETKGGVVLWIHGPQPPSNNEMYIMSQYEARPRFYNLPIESGETDDHEFFRNYSEIGPFEDVNGAKTLTANLQSLFAQWAPNASDYTINRARSNQLSPRTMIVSGQEGSELSSLWADQASCHWKSIGREDWASTIAIQYGIVNANTSAVLTTASEVNKPYVSNALAGATNGSIAPETVARAYSPPTVRVNNLANLEALLGMIANTIELAALAYALFWFIQAVRAPISSRAGQFATGASWVAIGLATPGFINWLLASARDANLFS